jgi:hypothetical protein
VLIRNETDRSYTLFLEFASPTDGYGSAVTPNTQALANEPGDGAHPNRFTLYDVACRPIADGAINIDDALIVIRDDGVDVGEQFDVVGEVPNLAPYDCRAPA